MKTYNDLMHSYRPEMAQNDIPSSTLKAFLFELCNEKGINLYLNLDNEVDCEILAKFEDGMRRIINKEPMNYVLNYCWFYGYRFNVNKNVLIPRYETEELAALILSETDRIYGDKTVYLADIGTGSGALAITLKLENTNYIVLASDISEKAIEIAGKNAQDLNAEVSFMIGDMLEPIKKTKNKLDILVSNPPYIPNAEELDISVREFEPHVALFGGDDGLKYYRIILKEAKEVMKEHGLIFFEIGYNQKDRLMKLANEYIKNSEIKCYRDISGKDRMLEIIF